MCSNRPKLSFLDDWPLFSVGPTLLWVDIKKLLTH